MQYQDLTDFRSLLFSRYGQPEGYGITIDIGGDELFGSTYRARDINKTFSFDTRRKKDGSLTTLFTVREVEPEPENWLKIWSEGWNDSITPEQIKLAASKVEPGLYKKETAK